MPIEYEGFGPDFKILVLLLEEGKIMRSKFSGKYGINYLTATNTLRRLEDAGLVFHEEVHDRRDTVYWDLTKKGIKVTLKLKELDALIGDSFEEDTPGSM